MIVTALHISRANFAGASKACLTANDLTPLNLCLRWWSGATNGRMPRTPWERCSANPANTSITESGCFCLGSTTQKENLALRSSFADGNMSSLGKSQSQPRTVLTGAGGKDFLALTAPRPRTLGITRWTTA